MLEFSQGQRCSCPFSLIIGKLSCSVGSFDGVSRVGTLLVLSRVSKPFCPVVGSFDDTGSQVQFFFASLLSVSKVKNPASAASEYLWSI